MIDDGDVAGVIAVTNPDTTIDIYMGSGGAPEGVLAAAALRCTGGHFEGRLLFRNEDEKARARKWGVTDLDGGNRRLAGRGRQAHERRADDHRKRGDARVVRHGALDQGRAPLGRPTRLGLAVLPRHAPLPQHQQRHDAELHSEPEAVPGGRCPDLMP